ncbi:MAG: mevalonate kinase [Candidatus Thermoplasmatota archaeon]|nr:mevalonate kinase [Candidatus Thermoplasmatota archaeon]
MMEASSPAKAILFGEHAVIYGRPAIALALNRRITVTAKKALETRVDGGKLSVRRHRYVRWAIENLWNGDPLSFRTRSRIPSASGLGSSAALSSSIVAILETMKGEWSERSNALNAFETEYNVQGGASPTDTSCSTHGGGILVSFEKKKELLWSISKGDRTWHVHHIEPPPMELVIGFTRRPSITHIQVTKVRNFYERSGFARETIDEIGEIVLDGLKALRSGDMVELGSLMNRNHSLLSILGVSSRELDKLKDSVEGCSYGAKLTGAGGGGSIIALTDRPEDCAASIKKRGGIPYIVKGSNKGTVVKVMEE